MRSFFWLLIFIPFLAFSQTDFDRAESLFRQGKYAQAQPVFQSIVKENPNHFKALEYLGDIQAHSGKWEPALVFYKKLKTAYPNVAVYQYKYGGVLAMIARDTNKFHALGMIGDIRQAFEKAIAIDPKHIEARWALVEYYLNLPGFVGGSEKKAARYANELLAISAVDGYLAKGRIAEYFERYAIAEAHYKKALEIGQSKTTCQKLADLYKNKMNQPEKAKAILARFSEKNKTS